MYARRLQLQVALHILAFLWGGSADIAIWKRVIAAVSVLQSTGQIVGIWILGPNVFILYPTLRNGVHFDVLLINILAFASYVTPELSEVLESHSCFIIRSATAAAIGWCKALLCDIICEAIEVGLRAEQRAGFLSKGAQMQRK